MEACAPVPQQWWHTLDVKQIRRLHMDAVIRAIRSDAEFSYTDIFRHPSPPKKVYQNAAAEA